MLNKLNNLATLATGSSTAPSSSPPPSSPPSPWTSRSFLSPTLSQEHILDREDTPIYEIVYLNTKKN